MEHRIWPKLTHISIAFVFGLICALSPACSDTDPSLGDQATSNSTSQVGSDAEEANNSSSDPDQSEQAPAAPKKSILKIESWDTAGAEKWDGPIADAYHETQPDHSFTYLSTPAAAYDDEIRARLEAGVAGDLIWCRSFDRSLALFNDGFLQPLDNIDTGDVPDSAFRAWTEPESGTRYCLPIASITQGFIYNKDAFDELGLTAPTTVPEFYETLDLIKADGRYVPLAIGLEDPWRIGNLGVNIMGPAYWGGEEGRQQLLNGEITFTDERFVALFRDLSAWGQYLPASPTFVDGGRSKTMFQNQEAIIAPIGSWQISEHSSNDFEIALMPPPRLSENDRCAMIDHPDSGIGINTASENKEEALELVEWIATEDFATVLIDSSPGIFSLQEPAPTAADEPLAAAFNSYRSECNTSLRLTAGITTDGAVGLERKIWELVGQAVLGQITPEQATASLDEEYGSYLAAPDDG